MRLKKVGIVSAGVTTALLAASPMAFAGDYPTSVKGAETGGKTEAPGVKDPGHPGHPGTTIDASQDCGFAGGNGAAGSLISGDSLANAVVQAPIAGNNIANLANCSNFLNNNLNGNLSGNQIAIGGGLLG